MKLEKLAFCSLVVVLLSNVEPFNRRLVTQWSTYKNQRWGFCMRVPLDWSKSQGIDGAGVLLYPQQPGISELSAIEVGARVDQPSEKNPGHMQTLDEIFDARPDILGKIENLRILEKEKILFHGNPAIYVKTSYRSSNQQWRAESISFVTKQGIVYLLELRCRSAEWENFDIIFRKIAFESFRLHCK